MTAVKRGGGTRTPLDDVAMSLDSALYSQPSALEIVRGKGVFVYDRDDRDYLDCSAGTFNLSLGYSAPEIVEVVQEQTEILIHLSSSYSHASIHTLAERLVELAPSSITKAHLKSSGGSTANEGAIKMAQAATGGRDVLSLFRSHVGQTLGALSYSGNGFRANIVGNTAPGRLVVPDPYCRRCFYGQTYGDCGTLCATQLDHFIEFASSGSVSCVIIEPISGNGGNIVPPPEYFPILAEICKRRGIPLICDEIQTGIGRTGYMFASEHFGIEPDAITVAKGLGGTGLPIAAILAGGPLLSMASDAHSFTFGGNILAATAAIKVLEIVSEESFLEHVRDVGAYLFDAIEVLSINFKFVEPPTGLGLMIGFEIVDNQGNPDVALTNEICSRAPEHGLLLRSSRYGQGNVVKIRPALNITRDEAMILVERLTAVLKSVEASS